MSSTSRPRRRSPSARSGCRPRPADAAPPVRARSRRSSRSWRPSGPTRPGRAGTALRRPGRGRRACQLSRHRDWVGRLALAVQVEDRLVDRLVGGAVHVVAERDLDDVGDGVLGQQHAAEDGLLGRDVLRRGPDPRPAHDRRADPEAQPRSHAALPLRTHVRPAPTYSTRATDTPPVSIEVADRRPGRAEGYGQPGPAGKDRCGWAWGALVDIRPQTCAQAGENWSQSDRSVQVARLRAGRTSSTACGRRPAGGDLRM